MAIIRTVVPNEETVNDNQYPGTRCLLLIPVCGQVDFNHAHELCHHHDNRTVSLPLIMKVTLRWDNSWIPPCPTAKLKMQVNLIPMSTLATGIITAITNLDTRETTAWTTLTWLDDFDFDLGLVLGQKQSGKEVGIAYAGRKLSPAEWN